MADADRTPSHTLHALREGGYLWRVKGPSNAEEDQDFLVSLYRGKDEEPLIGFRLPLAHRPTFGYDVDDISMLEQCVDEIIKLLPPPEDFSGADVEPLLAVVAKWSGHV